MPARVGEIFGARGTTLRGRIIGLYAVLIGVNVAAWAAALVAFRDHPVLLGTSFLAYTFGLRHAVDPDHIAAIDNVIRKLMQEGQRPVAAGFLFSLGHSTIVVLASAAIAVATTALQDRLASFREVGGVVSTTLSATFLFVIAGVNLIILRSVYRTFRQVRRGGRFCGDDLDRLLLQRGLLGRIFRPLFRLVAKSWHMYPLGFLFGLGFDTATEIGLLGLSAAEASKGLPIWSIMVFPALFTAGMSLVDTTDGIVMLGAYGWAFAAPIRKLYYNLTITLISVVVALIVGSVEALGLIADKMNLEGSFWTLIATLNQHFGMLGYLIIAVLVVSWLVSAAIYRIKRCDRAEPIGN